jgi:hypothetical protein
MPPLGVGFARYVGSRSVPFCPLGSPAFPFEDFCGDERGTEGAVAKARQGGGDPGAFPPYSIRGLRGRRERRIPRISYRR